MTLGLDGTSLDSFNYICVLICQGVIQLKSSKGLVVFMGCIMLLNGCSTPDSKSAEPQEKPVPASYEPTTIKLYASESYLNDTEIQNYIKEPLSKKYPHISLEVVRPVKDITLESLVVSGDVPDIFLNWNGGVKDLKTLGLASELDTLIAKQKFDLTSLESVLLDAIRNESEDKKLYAIPYAQNFQLMYYNKDIFDQVGVPYPKDGMTWEQAIDIGKTITAKSNGTYKGLHVTWSEMAFQLSLPFIDPSTQTSAMTGELWKRVFETAYNVWTIPDNTLTTYGDGLFLKDKTLAMWAYKNRNNQMKEPGEAGLRWDVVQFPTFKEKPGVTSQVDAHVAVISPTSKKKEDALRVLEMLTSKESQEMMSLQGRLPAMKTKTIVEEFGSNIPYLKDKNWKGVLSGTTGLPPKRLLPDSYFVKYAVQSFNDYVVGKNDLNTTLRKAGEQMDQAYRGNKRQ
ncbi:ABC transporter substrate-binding protein [Paenibacillus sp. UNC451MF]|uniref:ABC transporter substrate-binding protein n=1 Tax=Paenibacillus sp. UNC451MF TaxID=1449063 RepID=UPI00048FF42B|nr:extracellular solute-binding protein [Paenibacillus sp. UNC451MF]